LSILRSIPLLVALLLVDVLVAHAISVTFEVRMNHQIQTGGFDPATEFVDVAGTFNGWGSSPLTPLSDADGDSIYSVTVDGFTVGQQIEYKFRLNGVWDGREEFPGVGSNRRYTVQSGENTILVWYEDRVPDRGVGELAWWNDAVFYEIFVRSFHDSDGDGIGDLRGLIQKLDYLNDGDPNTTDDLGITGIWLMPIHDSPSYHGYDVVDYRSIHPDYGTLADFEEFLAAAHARGIRVIIDYVMNHSSSQHPWFVASRQNHPTYRDWYVWSANPPQQSGPWGQQVWHQASSGYYYGLFWGGMPDLNYASSALKAEMFDAATFWLDQVGVDGFRLDAVLYIHEDGTLLESTPATLDFWNEYNALVKSVRPDALSVGEAWTSSSTVNQYVVEDRLDFCFEFELSYAILGAANSGDAGFLRSKAQQVFDLYPYSQFGTFLTNHDQDRVMEVLGQDLQKARVAAGIYLTLPGVPFLYYGEEVGMLGSKPDPDIRRPMQWTSGANAGFTTGTPWRALNANYPQFNVATAQADSGSLWRWYQRLIAARHESDALRRGDLVVLETDAPQVMAFLRRYASETVLVLANTSADALGAVNVTGDAASLAAGARVLVDLLTPGRTLPVTVTEDHRIAGLALAAHEVAVLRFASATSTPEEEPGTRSTRLSLRPNVPNPFVDSTTIRFALPRTGHVRLGVYDLAGREVARLHDGTRAAGTHEIVWDGKDLRRRPVGNGIYFLRLEAGGESVVRKVVLAR
jgi:alpha-amylase